MSNKFIDLSHVISDGTRTYPGLPEARFSDYLSRDQSRERYGPGVEFQIGRIEMVANTGTYLDTPFHRYAEGFDLSQLPLETIANVPGHLIHAPWRDRRAIDATAFAGLELSGRSVLINTGWDEFWETPEYAIDNPYLTRDAAEFLVKVGVRIVGIDSVNIDDMKDLSRPAHSILLAAGIPIVEHLCGLGQLIDQEFLFFAIPPKFKGVGTFPVRAFAISTAG